jgi:hypothetical protein
MPEKVFFLLVHLLSVGNEIFTAIEKYIPALLLIWAVIRTLIQFLLYIDEPFR